MSVKNTILVHTQYQENYGAHDWDGRGDCPQGWKMKGGHTFEIKMDADILMYSDAAEVFSKMLEKHSNHYEKFSYVDHDVQFSVPTVLGSQEDFISANQVILKRKETA